jgi:hypothetical protein
MSTEFVLQIQKQQEDLAIVLASSKRQTTQGENTKQKHTTEETIHTKKGNTEKHRLSEFTRSSPLTLYKIIWNTPNAEIPKNNFSLLHNPLVLFNKVFRG